MVDCIFNHIAAPEEQDEKHKLFSKRSLKRKLFFNGLKSARRIDITKIEYSHYVIVNYMQYVWSLFLL